MSARHHLATRTGSSGAMTDSAGVMPHRRGVAGNHTILSGKDKYERQADEAAIRILRGEKNVGRILTPAPAASETVLTSVGEPLPLQVRERLEESFGADLRPVRLHHDAASASAARSFGARAFASGASIYFDTGEFTPQSEAGRRLLAHEIAHVIQQRGHAGPGNRISVVPGHGIGPVQCDNGAGKAEAAPSEEELKKQGTAFDALADIHRGGKKPSGDTELEDVIDKARTLLGGRLVADHSKPAFATPLRDAAVRGDFAKLKSTRAKSYVFECLKLLGFFEQAARMLESDKNFEMRVLTASPEFFEFLKESPNFGRKWTSQFLSHRDFAPFWPSVIVRHWRNFFLRPSFVEPVDKALLQRLEANVKEINTSTAKASLSLRAEHYFLAWRTIGEIDEDRAKEAAELGKRLLSLSGKGRGLRATLVDAMPRLRLKEQAKIDSEELSAAERRIAKEKIAIIDELLPFWQQVLAEYSTWRAKFLSLSPNDVALGKAIKGLPDGSQVAPLLEPFRKPLVEAAAALFAPIAAARPAGQDTGASGVRLPTIEEYSARLQAFTNALTVQMTAKKGGTPQTWADRVEALLVEQANTRKADPKTKLTLAMLPLIVGDLLVTIKEYDAKKDAESPSFEDRRAAHRFMTARVIAFIARWLHWDDLMATVRGVLTGDEDKSIAPEDRQAELWLISDWEPDAVQSVGVLAEDFPETLDKPVLRETPLTLRHIIEWFRFSYSHSLRNTIEDLLRVEDFLTEETKLDIGRINRLRQTKKEVAGAMAPSAEAELAIADANAKEFPITVPQRFIVRDWMLRVPPGSAFDWNALIIRHKKTEKQFIRRAAATIFPTDVMVGVFGWALPPLDGLILFMKRIPAIAALAKNNQLEGADWLAQLAPDTSSSPTFTAADAKKIHLSAADWARLNEVLLLWLKKWREEEEKALPRLWQRLAVLYRRSQVLRLRPRIDYYAEYPTVTGGPFGEKTEEISKRLKIPDDVVNAFYRFEPMVRSMLRDADDPGAAAEVQTALFIFGLSPSLLKVNLALAEGYFKRHLFAFFTLATDYATDTEKLKLLRGSTEIQDEVNSIVQSKTRLDETVAAMKARMTSIETELEERQEETGFSGVRQKFIVPNASRTRAEIEVSDKPDPAKEWRIHRTIGRDGHLDPESGILYRLRAVYRDFKFVPHAGSRPVKSLPHGAGGPYSPAKLTYVDDYGEGHEVFEPDKHPELADVPLFSVQIGDGEPTKVYANNLAELEQLSDIFFWRSFQIEMEAIAAGIETFEQYLITVVALVFPEAAMAEFVVSMAQMFASGEFEDLILQLKNDPIGLVEKLASDLKERLFTPENIWKFILLGMRTSPWSTLAGLLPKRERKVSPPPTTKFGRVVSALRSLGARFNHALHRIREYTQPPLRSVQGRIGMHPTLVWVIHRAVHLGEAAFDLIPFDKLESARKGDAPSHLVEFADVLLGEQGSVQQELSNRVIELLEGIRRMELPGELIDLQIATELIIDFILARFGPRGKIVRLLLETAPVPSQWAGRGGGVSRAMDVITYEIKKVWSGTLLDPNKYWIDDVMPIIGSKFTEIRDDLVEGIYSVLGKVLEAMGIPRLRPPEQAALPKTEVVPDTLLPEGEAAAAQGGTIAPSQAEFPEGGGVRLAPTQQARFERTLAADLSHVRVHAGTPQATSAVGADAMTSGSHVYLRPGISPASSKGTGLLAHELTHVVQQTGASTSGTYGHRTPALGRAGLGIRHDPARESIAERIASRVAGGERVSAGLRAQIGSAAGAQPAMAENIVEGVLDVLTERTEPKEFEKGLEGGDPPGWSDAKRLIDAIAQRLKSEERVKFAAFMQGDVDGTKVSTEILKYLGNPFRNDVAMKRVAMLGQKPIKKKKEDDPDTELDPKRFLQILANHVFAEVHVALKITISSDLKEVSDLEIFNIDLAGIGGTARLWQLAMSGSFKGNPDVPDLAKAQREIRQRLQALRAQPSIWDSKQFRFASWLIDEYVAQVKARAAAKVSDVPKVSEYVDVKSGSGQGLAVATHGQLTSRGIGAFGRESHHTTQYLLIEFFSNHKESSQKGFPEPIEDFTGAGLTFNAKREVAEIRGPGGAISVAPLNPDSGRGSLMPAILLSARCHQRGELHVLRESRWVDNSQQDMERKGTVTQGLAIENTFNKAITDAALRPRETSTERRTALRARIAADPVRVSQQYYSAALATYRWMRDRMIKEALKPGLLTEEKAYYRGIAAQNHAAGDELQPSWDLQDHHLTHVYDQAAKNNDEIMTKYGWKL